MDLELTQEQRQAEAFASYMSIERECREVYKEWKSQIPVNKRGRGLRYPEFRLNYIVRNYQDFTEWRENQNG